MNKQEIMNFIDGLDNRPCEKDFAFVVSYLTRTEGEKPPIKTVTSFAGLPEETITLLVVMIEAVAEGIGENPKYVSEILNDYFKDSEREKND